MLFTKKKIDIPDPIQILVDMVCNRIVMEPSRVTASNGTSGYTIKDEVRARNKRKKEIPVVFFETAYKNRITI